MNWSLVAFADGCVGEPAMRGSRHPQNLKEKQENIGAATAPAASDYDW
jgi:hypothetical protein